MTDPRDIPRHDAPEQTARWLRPWKNGRTARPRCARCNGVMVRLLRDGTIRWWCGCCEPVPCAPFGQDEAD